MDKNGKGASSITAIIRHLNHSHRKYTRPEFEVWGIYRGQPPLLLLLARSGEMTQKEIARELGLSPPTINKMVHRMMLKDFIVKKADPDDLRTSRISLSPRGHSLIAKIRRITDREEEMVCALFSSEEREKLIEMLLRIEKAYEEVL